MNVLNWHLLNERATSLPKLTLNEGIMYQRLEHISVRIQVGLAPAAGRKNRKLLRRTSRMHKTPRRCYVSPEVLPQSKDGYEKVVASTSAKSPRPHFAELQTFVIIINGF